LYMNLFFVGIFFCCFFDFTGVEGIAAHTFLGDMLYRLVFKYLYLTSTQRLYFVLGMMFSGKTETAMGNTVYQNLVFHMYLIWKMSVYKLHEMFYLLKLSISKKLITKSFSGDDNLIGYPLILEHLFGICGVDFYKFAKLCGLTNKYLHEKVLYGKACFYSIGSFFKIDKTQFVDSCCFLKCKIMDIYETDAKSSELKYRGRYMYRPTEDIIFRLCNSDKANAYIESFFAKILSLMFLCVGNIEAYSILVTVFYLAKSVYRWAGVFDKDRIVDYLGSSGHMDQLGLVFDYTGTEPVLKPPTLKYIREKYDVLADYQPRPLLSFNDMYKYDLKGISDQGFFS